MLHLCVLLLLLLPLPLLFPGEKIVQHKLTLIRKKDQPSGNFRSLFREISFYLGYEATQDLLTREVKVRTEAVETKGYKVSSKVAIIPVLRGGLGMTDSLLDMVPNAPVYHIGMYRSAQSELPVQYYNNLPKGHPADVAVVLDPVIVRGNTICAVISMLKKWGCPQIKLICLVASKPGLQMLLDMHPDVFVHCCAVDELSVEGELVPGLGDAGDRLYLGPDHIEHHSEQDESERKRMKA